jgi:hypothetical protein
MQFAICTPIEAMRPTPSGYSTPPPIWRINHHVVAHATRTAVKKR